VKKAVLLVAFASVALLGCSGSGSGSGSGATTSSTQAPQSGTVTVSVIDNNFRPADITVTKGSIVVWTNEGRAEHNIVAFGPTPFHVDTKSFPPGSTYSWIAGETGTFRYYCSIHGTATAAMYGSVTVVDP
jgi:plastocyanin